MQISLKLPWGQDYAELIIYMEFQPIMILYSLSMRASVLPSLLFLYCTLPPTFIQHRCCFHHHKSCLYHTVLTRVQKRAKPHIIAICPFTSGSKLQYDFSQMEPFKSKLLRLCLSSVLLLKALERLFTLHFSLVG